MTQPWCFPLNAVSTPTVCGVSLCAAAERNFGDEADDLTLKVKAKDCDCADQLYGSTLTTRDTSVTSLTPALWQAAAIRRFGGGLRLLRRTVTRLRTERSPRLASPFQRTSREVCLVSSDVLCSVFASTTSQIAFRS